MISISHGLNQAQLFCKTNHFSPKPAKDQSFPVYTQGNEIFSLQRGYFFFVRSIRLNSSSRANQAHITFQDIKELGKLIDTKSSRKVPTDVILGPSQLKTITLVLCQRFFEFRVISNQLMQFLSLNEIYTFEKVCYFLQRGQNAQLKVVRQR